MANIMEEAKEYQPPQTKNIADLEVVSTDLVVVEEEHTRKEDGKNFKIKVVEVDGEKYRVPASVLGSLKVIAEEQPDLKFFKVKKSGSGLTTSYTVIPIESKKIPEKTIKDC